MTNCFLLPFYSLWKLHTGTISTPNHHQNKFQLAMIQMANFNIIIHVWWNPMRSTASELNHVAFLFSFEFLFHQPMHLLSKSFSGIHIVQTSNRICTLTNKHVTLCPITEPPTVLTAAQESPLVACRFQSKNTISKLAVWQATVNQFGLMGLFCWSLLLAGSS